MLKTPLLVINKALLYSCLQVFDSLDVVRSVSTEIFVLNKARWMFHLSQIFTEEQKPFNERLGSWCILSLTDSHRGTEAIQRTSLVVACFISHRFSQRDRSLSANRGNTQTSASRRQISQSVIAIYHRTLHPSLAETLCVIG